MFVPVSLFLISVAAGVGLLWIFSKTSNQAAIRTTKKRLQARLLEFRIYADDPGVVLRAQRALLAENLRYFLLMLRPAVFATLPMILLLVVMEGYYGKRPLEPGRSAVVTAQLVSLDPGGSPPALETPAGIVVEAGGVRTMADSQVSWRIRPEGPVDGELRITVPGDGEATKHIIAGSGAHLLANRRVSSWLSWLIEPVEPPLSSDSVKWIEVKYPMAEVAYFGVGTHWLVWFLLFSMVTAFLLKDRFGVTV